MTREILTLKAKWIKRLSAVAVALSLGLVLASCATKKSNTTSKETSYSYVNEDGSFTVGKSGAIKTKDISKKATLDVYVDPLCPSCGTFDRETSEYLTEKVNSGDLYIHYHPLMFLDQGSSDNYSTRASSYVLAVTEHAPKLAQKFVTAIYEKSFQPEEGDDYKPVSNAKLDALAKGVGVTKAQLNAVHKDLKAMSNITYKNTVRVMKDKKLVAKSPTGELFTPFIIPNKAGSDSGKALSFESDMLTPTKKAVENILK